MTLSTIGAVDDGDDFIIGAGGSSGSGSRPPELPVLLHELLPVLADEGLIEDRYDRRLRHRADELEQEYDYCLKILSEIDVPATRI